MSTLLTSEYWCQSTPDALRQEIARRTAEPSGRAAIVKAVSHERLEFKILWNHSLLINQLPNEILIQIFAFASVHFAFATDFWWWDTRFWTLMVVCRHWRDLIVDTPVFWCILDLTKNANWTQLCLSRSLTIPINIWVEVSLLRHLDRLRVAYPLVHRIRSLVLRLWSPVGDPDSELHAVPRLLFGDGMRVLEKLDFTVTRYGYYLDHFPIDTDIELTSMRFPRLRNLTLAEVVAPQDPSLYTQLRALSLKGCSHQLSFDRFLDALDACTRLEDLDLENTLDRLSGDWMQRDPSPRRPLISFPHLNKLVLRAHGAACTSRFLAHLHIRSSVRLHISAEADDDDADARSPDGACSMAAMLPPASPGAAANLEALATARDIHMYMSMDSNSTQITTNRTPEMFFSVLLTMAFGPRNPPNPHTSSRWGSVSDLVELFGRSPVTSLSIADVHPDTVAAWATVFRTFPLLERLSIQAGWGTGCAVGLKNVFLGLHAASTADPDSSTVACPNLAHVSVRAVNMQITKVYGALRTCFRFRGDKGVVLSELKLEFLTSPKSPQALYRACVKDIVDCTERLSMYGVSLEESEEGECVRAPAETRPGRDQGAVVSGTDAEMHGGRVPEAFEGKGIGLRQPFKSLRRLVETFRRSGRDGRGEEI
ncbi:hypothetical protein LXA43DRAFT_1081217 [Ganoderma leucocontextum]|nr:hypothetical protein LXA43DRAFT_1081217 [Ganoderma leucocontextum]